MEITWIHTCKLKIINKVMIYWKQNCNINSKTKWKFKIWKFYFIYSCVSHKYFFIYKSCVWIKNFQNMVIKMLFSNKIQIYFFELNLHLKKNSYSCGHYWSKFMNIFSIFSFGQIINKIWLIIFEVLCNV